MFFKKKLDFIIIGAQKSGTTSLHNYLDNHPDIFMSKPLKEPRYFIPIDFTKKYYMQQKNSIIIKNSKDLYKNFMLKGYNGELCFGESSTDYTLADKAVKHNIPLKIYKHNKNMKLIYILRNPFERLYSNYQHDKRKQRYLNTSFGDYLKSEENQLVKTSLYYYQLIQYLQYFLIQNIILISFSNFINDTNTILKKIFDFLEVSAQNYNFQTRYKEYNKGTDADEIKIHEAFKNHPSIKQKITDDAKIIKDNFGLSIL